MGNIFDTVLIYPLINLLVLIYHFVSNLHIPYALGFSIILLTIVVRFILYPLTGAQLKSSQKLQKLTPHLQNVREKHKGDAKRLQAETMKLYKEHGVNPAAGCLPVLIQLPLIWALYTVLQRVVTESGEKSLQFINSIVYSDSLKLTSPWDPHFFGVELAKSPSQLLPDLGVVVFLIPVLTGVLQFIQTKMMYKTDPALVKRDPSKEKKADDFATVFQKQSLYVFPAMIGFFSYTFPIGLSLYWNTFTIFGILQQYKISGLGDLEKYVPWKQKNKK